jgi:hypothetical protein
MIKRTRIAIYAVNLFLVNDLIRKNENYPEVKGSKTAYLAS